MEHINDTLLQAMPDPALITERGRVLCFNSAARALFPDLAQGGPAPDSLPAVPGAGGLVLAGERSWHVTASPLKGGLLLLLYPARLEGLSAPQLEGTVRCLREQMSQLLLSLQLLSRTEDPELEDRLSSMNHTLCRMLRQINHLDLLKELDRGMPSYRPVTLDLAGLCREVADLAAPLLDRAGVRLCFDSSLTSLLVVGDCALLQHLLLELLSNAAQTAGRGGTVTLSLSYREQRALLTLTNDTFRPDYRPLTQLLSGTLSLSHIPSPGEGAGLGLALAQRIVALHRGALLMERREEAAVSVTAALPLSKPGPTLPVHTPAPDYTSGFPPALVALAEVLPTRVYCPADLE